MYLSHCWVVQGTYSSYHINYVILCALPTSLIKSIVPLQAQILLPSCVLCRSTASSASFASRNDLTLPDPKLTFRGLLPALSVIISRKRDTAAAHPAAEQRGTMMKLIVLFRSIKLPPLPVGEDAFSCDELQTPFSHPCSKSISGRTSSTSNVASTAIIPTASSPTIRAASLL